MVAVNKGKRAGGQSVAIINSFPLFRAGVAYVLRSHFAALEIEQGSTAADAVRIAGLRRIDIMMIDHDLLGAECATLHILSRTYPNMKLLVLANSENESDVASSLSLGARGYVLCRISESELISAVEAIANDEVFLSPDLGARLIGKSLEQRSGSSQASPAVDLTQRELEILEQVSAGATNKEIAIRLHIREKTVKFHMTNVMQKLHVRNRVEAVVALRGKARVSV